MSQIKWQVRARMQSKGSVKMVGNNNIGLVHHWNLHNLKCLSCSGYFVAVSVCCWFC